MKKYTKRITCIALAVAAAATLTLAAFAAEYASAPSFSDTPSQSTNVTTSDLNEAINDASENEDGVPVAKIEASSTDNLTLSATVMKTLADKGEVILQIDTDEVTIEIDASTIENTKKINLSMNVQNTSNRTVVSFKSSAEFGCEVKVIIKDCKMSATKLENASVYFNGYDMGSVEFTEDGLPFFIATEGGRYEIK